MTNNKDGSIRFRQPLPMIPSNYTQDPNDPCLYWPRFEPCIHRFRPEAKTPCGKIKYGGHTCRVNGELITVNICKECNIRQE